VAALTLLSKPLFARHRYAAVPAKLCQACGVFGKPLCSKVRLNSAFFDCLQA